MLERLVEAFWEWAEDSIEDFCDAHEIDFLSVYQVKQASGAATGLAFFFAEVLRGAIQSARSN
jgi:hypothetical protein